MASYPFTKKLKQKSYHVGLESYRKSFDMNKILKPIISKIEKRFGGHPTEFRNEISVIIKPEHIMDVSRYLLEEADFNMLLDVTAVDYWPETNPRFHVVYHFYSMENNIIIALRVPLNGSAPEINSIEKIYPNANWYEREIWDLMGVSFKNHSDLRRIVMPSDWEGHPLRKDYPLGYEEVQYTFNFDDINQYKRYPKD